MPERPPLLRLRIVHPPEADAIFELDGSTAEVLGRVAPRLTLQDARVSRRHAELKLTHGVWTIADLGSSNGTYVNGVRIQQLTQLETGDQLRLGRIEIAVLEAAPPPPVQAPAPVRPAARVAPLGHDTTGLLDRPDAPSPGDTASAGTVFGAAAPSPAESPEPSEAVSEEQRAQRLRELAQQLRQEALAAEAAAQRLSDLTPPAPAVPDPAPPAPTAPPVRVPPPGPEVVARQENQSWPDASAHRARPATRAVAPPRSSAASYRAPSRDYEALTASAEHTEVVRTPAQERELRRKPGRRKSTRVRHTVGVVLLVLLVAGGGLLVWNVPPQVLGDKVTTWWSSVFTEYQRIRGVYEVDESRQEARPSRGAPEDGAGPGSPDSVDPDSLLAGGPALTWRPPNRAEPEEALGPASPEAGDAEPGTGPDAVLPGAGDDGAGLPDAAANPRVATAEEPDPLPLFAGPSLNGVGEGEAVRTGPAPTPAVLALGGLSGSTGPTAEPYAPAAEEPENRVAPDPEPEGGSSTTTEGADVLMPETTPPAALAAGPERRVVFLVDCSGSTIDSATHKLLWVSNAVQALPANERFAVVFFRDAETVQREGGGLAWPTPSVKKRVADWLASPGPNLRPRGTSRVEPAFAAALAYKPDEIVLLSDNRYGRSRANPDADRVRADVRAVLKNRGVQLHTVQFFYEDTSHLLETLAADHGGTFEFWAEDRQAEAPTAEGVDLLRALGG